MTPSTSLYYYGTIKVITFQLNEFDDSIQFQVNTMFMPFRLSYPSGIPFIYQMRGITNSLVYFLSWNAAPVQSDI